MAFVLNLEAGAAPDMVSLVEEKDRMTTRQKNFGWRFGNGPEFPGATGKLTVDDTVKFKERGSLRLDTDFSKGGAYIDMLRTIPGIDISQLSLWLKDPDSDALTLRLGDDSGQVHQIKLRKPRNADWQEVVFPLADFFARKDTPEALAEVTEYKHWAGANDGKWYGPATMIALLATKTEATSRTLWVGDITITPAAEAPKSTVDLDQFDKLEWQFSTSHSMPWAKGSLALAQDEADGKKSMKLVGDFTDGGGYVAASRDINRNLLAVRMRYKTDNVTFVTVRLVDGTGQTHQRKRIPLVADGKWQELVIKPYKIAGSERWGGANDGKWHGPLAAMSICIPSYAKADVQQFSLLIADVRGEAQPGQEGLLSPITKPDDSIPLPVSVLPAAPEKLVSRPAFGFPIKYRWQAAQALDKNYSVFVHIVDGEGKTVLLDDHQPPTETSKWNGLVEYERTVFLPAHSPRGERTFPGMGDGRYTIYAGLSDETGRKVLAADSSIKPDDQRRYAIGTLTVDSNAPLPEMPPKTLDLAGYKLTFSDDFDGPLSVSAWGPCGPEGSKWIAHTPFRGDFGDARFADPTPDFPFTIKDGILRIEVRKEGARWRGGLLSSADPQGKGFSQKYGYFEMRAKLPQGPGTWPAFWLHAIPRLTQASDMTLTHIEIDVLEQYGHWPNKLCTALHQWPRSGKGAVHEGKNYLVTGMTEDFHTYGVMVTEEFITIYYDGRELRREKTPPSGHVPLYVMLNLTLGPGWPLDKTPSPSFMEVDHVKVYAKQ